MGEVAGTDKIVPLAEIPQRVELPRSLMGRGQELLGKWAVHHMAFVPYCVQCKEVLNWVTDEGDVLFRCPKCGREWVKDNDWLLMEMHKVEEE